MCVEGWRGGVHVCGGVVCVGVHVCGCVGGGVHVCGGVEGVKYYFETDYSFNKVRTFPPLLLLHRQVHSSQRNTQ